MNHDDAYEPGSGKRSDYCGPQYCVWCQGMNGHMADCVEVQS